MMHLHQLSSIQESRKKRIGRGGKRGSYSGRGIKGQKSRAGRRMRPALRDLLLRLPKRRGSKNKPLREKPFAVNLADMGPLLGKSGTVIDVHALREARVVPKHYKGKVKVLGTGEVNAPVTFKGLEVSESVKMKIEKAGGKVE